MELPGAVYRFERFELDPSNVRLTADGAVCQLEPKSFRLLQFLIENRHRVVPKEELLTAVWEGVAVSDNALTRAIAQVRKALEDDPKDPTYIETIPTIGYRFMAAVEEDAVSVGPILVESPAQQSSRQPFPHLAPQPAGSRKLIWGAVAVAVVVAAGLVAARFVAPGASSDVKFKPVPFTTYPGREYYPTFSPDGNQVAFTWNGEHDDNYDIYVKAIGSETPLRLTTAPEMDLRPQWSPDGRSIAFERPLPGGKTALMLIPPVGGAERKLAEFTYIAAQANGLLSNGVVSASGLSWSRDGKWIAVSGDFAGDGVDRINLVSAETGEFRPITQSPIKDLNDYDPSFSPYSDDLVFVRAPTFTAGAVYRLSFDQNFVAKGEPAQIYASKSRLFWPSWVSGGRELVIAGGLAGIGVGGSVYRLPALGTSSLSPIESLGTEVTSLAVSRNGQRAVYSVGTRNANIWRLDLGPSDKSAAPKAESLVVSTKREVHPQYSPDGRRIVFYSNRSGSTQIWVCEADGSKPVMITNMPPGTTGSPRWSPDGRTVVFDSNVTGRFHIYTVSADGGKVRQMTNGPSSFAASYSHDGKWIYYSLTEEKATSQVWKIPSQGGTPMQVTHNGGIAPQESPDGKTLYYAKPVDKGSLWKMPGEGGQEKQLADSIYRSNYAITSKGIYLMSGPAIELLNPETGERKTIFKTKNPDLGLSASPDGRYLLWSQVDAIGSDLMLVENFR